MAVFENSNTAKADEGQEATKSFKSRFAAFLRKIWWSMSVMKENFESEGDGSRSRERSEERLRDEEAWSRMDGEGCPNVQSRIRIGSRSTTQEKPLPVAR